MFLHFPLTYKKGNPYFRKGVRGFHSKYPCFRKAEIIFCFFFLCEKTFFFHREPYNAPDTLVFSQFDQKEKISRMKLFHMFQRHIVHTVLYIYHAVVFTDYDLCTKFIVSCD